MCGIAGIYNFKRGNLYKNYFFACLKTMKYRGPDDEDIWDNGENYLAAFVRLSIRDLSINGRQPMFSSNRKFCISFNGEIYNSEELKQLLRPFNIGYHSSTDTEILLYAIIHLGIQKALSVADGIFAFAWYDLEKNRLILARDRVGVKPLYIGTNDKGVVYSSQYDHIINHPYFNDQDICASSVGNYLQFGYIPEEMGAVKNTKLLLHGHYYIIENNRIDAFTYYQYGINNNNKDRGNISLILNNSVKSQLVADVPVGTFMSGGVDSTLVTYYANQNQPTQSFTIGVKDSVMDESETAKHFAAIFGTKHSCKFIDIDGFKKLIKDHVQAFSEPFADYSSLPTLLLSAFAREKVTVALSGDGGDELFWGYPRNIKALSLIPFYQKKILTRRVELIMSKIKKPANTHISRHWHMQNFIEYYYSALAITGANMWLPRLLNTSVKNTLFYEKIKNNVADMSSVDEMMDIIRVMEVDIHLQRILLKVDRASMFHSLEVRVPFLSNKMLDLSESLHYTDCIKGNNGKVILKQLLASCSNEKLVYNPKKGFSIPIDDWLKTDLKNEIIEKLMDMPAHLAIMFKRKSLWRLYNNYMNGVENTGWLVWAIYILVLWDNTHRNKIK